MSVVELKSQKGSLDRAVRYLKKARDAVRQEMSSRSDGTSTSASQNLSAQVDLLKDQIANVDALLSKFEQTAASTEDETFRDEQTAWEDLVFECQSLCSQAKQLLKAAGSNPNAPTSHPSTPSSAPHDQGLNDQFARLLTLLEHQQTAAAQGSPTPSSGGYGSVRTQFTRLPKLELPKFEGDIIEWQQFWDRFETSVDKNENLANVDKLNYLLSMLGKDPLMVIKSLPVTNENYTTAKSLLQTKYGDKKIVVALLYRKLNEMRPVKNDVVSLRRFVAEIDCLLGSLGTLGQSTNDDSFAAIILSKLPNQVVVLLEICKDLDTPWTIDLVRSKLNEYLVRVERAAKVSAIPKGKDGPQEPDFWEGSFHAGEGPKGSGGKQKKSNPRQGKPGPDSKRRDAKSAERKPSCVFCDGSHYSDCCEKFVSADDRFSQLKGRCSVCLSDKHRKKDCHSKKPCYYCKQVANHHSSLCFKKFGRNHVQSGHVANEDESPDPQPEEKAADGSALLASGESVALQTAQIPVKSDHGSKPFLVTRALFDPGANRSYCSVDLAHKLSLKLEKGPELRVNRFGSDSPVVIQTQHAKLRVKKLDGSTTMIEVSVIPKITGKLSRVPICSKKLEKLQTRVKLADSVPKKLENSSIDLLVGNDYYLDFITGDKIEVEPGLYLLGSEFGFILSGRSSTPKLDDYGVSMCGFTYSSLEGLEDIVGLPKENNLDLKKPEMSDFWSLEHLGIKDDPEVTSDDVAIDNFRQNVQFVDGRYSVSLPWNEKAPELTGDHALCTGRLGSLVRKLKSNDDLFGKYDAIIQDQLEKGVIEKVDPTAPSVQKHYIPHHAVVTPQKETTKVRIVYDGSAKTKRQNPSLNECLHRGPILLEDLAGLLMRFRKHKIGIVADIEKAFLQIGINASDRDMLRFLWLKDPKLKTVQDNIEEYRFCRVLFGLNCSPSLLAQTVEYHLVQTGGEVAEKIRRDLYVDNVISGCDTVGDAIQLYREAKKIFDSASMNLREWVSNSGDLMKEIAEKDRSKSTEKLKVLGLRWNTVTDMFSISPNSKQKHKCETKRQFLSQISAIFDPLGFFTPATLQAKVLLQEACQTKPPWDSKMPDQVLAKWQEEQNFLSAIPDCSIPRHVPMNGQCMLIAFCDASAKAFATAIYIRCDHGNGVNVNLLMSKSRLNPEKKMSMPRLELMGILIGVRALTFVNRQLNLPNCKAVLFSDSTCALSWVKAQKGSDRFVGNRVSEIAKKGSDWVAFSYVPTDQNPADWATRGKPVPELTSFWWKGPPWLQNPLTGLNTWLLPQACDERTEITPKPICNMGMVVDTSDLKLAVPLETFSKHLKLLRVTAWCLRFINRLKNGQARGGSIHLRAEELDQAKLLWEIQVQNDAFLEIREAVRTGKSHSMAKLAIFEDPDGLLRCKGRMEKSNLDWETKYPKLMPKSHPYTKLLVTRIHEDNGHSSALQTLGLMRKEYWVPRGRQLIRNVTQNCVTCRKALGRPFALPQMPELPIDRVVPQPCFTSTGVDYFGPIRIKLGNAPSKAWVALFTCLTTRAVHLELVLDLSADQFLMALRRFIARRGKPTKMLSDNAPQFKVVAKLTEVAWAEMLHDPEILDFCSREGISWSHIVEFAPYMGGVYERLVGIVKTCLRKTIGSSFLSPKRFETLLCECEAIVNSRPLSYIGPNLDDSSMLTPAHFLSLNPRIAVPGLSRQLKKNGDLYFLDSPTSTTLLDSWKKGQNLLDEFWFRWKTEYLGALREQMTYRHKKNQGSVRTPIIGEVVLMKESSLPRGSWKLAKVVTVHLSADKLIRSVSVELPSGRRLNRPVNLIVPLEISSQTETPLPVAPIPQTDKSQDDSSSGRASPELLSLS